MRIVIAGASGFLGRALARGLAADGHLIVALTRGGALRANAAVQPLSWQPDGSVGAWADAVDGAGAVINLAGESIAGRRWSNRQKMRILDSRVGATRSLVDAIARAAVPPPVFVSGSAVGYYGPLDDELATETTPPGSDFLARVCVQWEHEALRAADVSSGRTRVVLMRTGLVLEKDGGALPQMLPPFKLGIGGRVGSGTQYWPWIHRADWIALVRFAIAASSITGPLNATAPTPVTNADFARALGRALHRPSFMPAPAFALRLLLGEMADSLLLSGQRAVPARALREGFAFAYQRVEDALGAIFSRSIAM